VPILAGLLLLPILLRGPALPLCSAPLRPLTSLAPEPPPPRCAHPDLPTNACVHCWPPLRQSGLLQCSEP
jgi:hypothetical protein